MSAPDENVVLKYCEILDEFIRVRATNEEDAPRLLTGTDVSSRAAYHQLVVNLCVVEFNEQVLPLFQRHNKVYQSEALVELLYQVALRKGSAGQRRRLSLARLLVAPAELWLLDEPSVGLDEDSLARLHGVLSERRQAGGRLVAATHARLDLPEAEQLSLADFAPGPESPWEEEAW